MQNFIFVQVFSRIQLFLAEHVWFVIDLLSKVQWNDRTAVVE